MKVILFGSSNKSWAFAMEQIALKKGGERIVLIDAKYLEGNFLIRASKSRREFQEELIRNSLDLDLEKLTFKLSDLASAFNLFFLYFRGINRNEFPLLKCADIDLTQILKCRLAARLGTRFFEMKDVKMFMFVRFGFQTYVSAKHSLNIYSKYKEEKNIELFLYNGRFPVEAAFYKTWSNKDIKKRFVERGSDKNKYQIFEISPHYHPNWWSLIQEFNKSNPCENSLKWKAEKFKGDKLMGLDTYKEESWNVDYKEKDSTLKDGFILFLTSSTTEFSPNHEHNFISGYENQIEAVEDLLKEVKKSGLKLVIKRHPNSVGFDWVDRENNLWEKFKFDESVKYFGPESRVSSYSLAKSASRIFVWKSSMGFEALAMGKNTFCLASAKWAWLEMFQIKDKESINKAMSISQDSRIVSQVLEQYSNFMANSGTKYTLFTKVDKDFVYTNSGEKLAKSNMIFLNILTNFIRLRVLKLKPKRNA